MHDIDLDNPPKPLVPEVQEMAITQYQEPPTRTLSPLDLPVKVFKAGLARRGENRKALMEWVRKALVEGTDFGSVPTKRGPSKPSLWKPGAEKICGMLGVSVVFPTLKDYEQAAVSGVALDTIILRCELKDSLGNVLAEGVGARSITKEYGDTNKALKMAEKSAHIDATLRLAGLSEVFTQDLEVMQADGDLTEVLEESIEQVRARKEAELAALKPEVREMLEKAKANREAAKEELERGIRCRALGRLRDQAVRVSGHSQGARAQTGANSPDGASPSHAPHACDKCGSAVQVYTAKAGHQYEQCEAAHGRSPKAQAVYAEGGHHYKRLP